MLLGLLRVRDVIIVVVFAAVVYGAVVGPDLWVLTTGTSTTARVDDCTTETRHSRGHDTEDVECTATWRIGARTHRGSISGLDHAQERPGAVTPVRANAHRAVTPGTGRSAVVMAVVMVLIAVAALGVVVVRRMRKAAEAWAWGRGGRASPR